MRIPILVAALLLLAPVLAWGQARANPPQIDTERARKGAEAPKVRPQLEVKKPGLAVERAKPERESRGDWPSDGGGRSGVSDSDGDGHAAIHAGGDDCDDDDASRFPGNTEVPDRRGHDEDCDWHTFGRTDEDGDRWDAAWACNHYAGRSYCGDDCDDADPSIHPAQVDVCNGVDDDCDGEVDEGLRGCPGT